MPTQIQQLEKELISAEAKYGKDAPIVRALRQQLAAYKSMERGREERFLVGTRSAPPPAGPVASTTSTPPSGTLASDTGGATTAKSDSPQDETEADGKELGALRLARWRHHNDQLKKS